MRYIIGIDEVGRGCLAGPVTVTALCIPTNYKLPTTDLVLKDSKQLSSEQREEWFAYIRSSPNITYITKSVSPKIIDKMNISAAANLAAHRALKELNTNYSLTSTKCNIYLDGGLFVKNKKYQKEIFTNAETIVKADEKIKAVSLASIVAKVSRDKYMVRLHKKHPNYGFNVHKGYGTKMHRHSIRKYGLSSADRLTFLTKYNKLSPLSRLSGTPLWRWLII